MPFDPAKPAFGSPDSSAEMRDQFNGLKELIDAMSGVTSVQVDAVNTVAPGEPANVSVSIAGGVLHFSFDIPSGADGPQGPPFASAVVDGVDTLNPGDDATVSTSFDGSDVHFAFGIPRGADGTNGTDGAQGLPGEVTDAALASAIEGTSANTNGVDTLDTLLADPDVEALRQKLNEIILNGRR